MPEYTIVEYAEILIEQYADEGEEITTEQAKELALFRAACGDIVLID